MVVGDRKTGIYTYFSFLSSVSLVCVGVAVGSDSDTFFTDFSDSPGRREMVQFYIIIIILHLIYIIIIILFIIIIILSFILSLLYYVLYYHYYIMFYIIIIILSFILSLLYYVLYYHYYITFYIYYHYYIKFYIIIIILRYILQWNLRIKDNLGPGILSVVRRLVSLRGQPIFSLKMP